MKKRNKDPQIEEFKGKDLGGDLKRSHSSITVKPKRKQISKLYMFCPAVEDCIRILIKSGRKWRPIFWFRVAKDLSIYMGPRIKQPTKLKTGSKQPGVSSTFISYNEGDDINDKELLKSPKVSFHGTGMINFPGGQISSSNIRKNKKQMELCHVLFQDPKKFKPVELKNIGDRDVCLDLNPHKRSPLQASMHVAYWSGFKRVQNLQISDQRSLIFKYENNVLPEPFIFQIVIGNSAPAQWPPMNYVIFKASTNASDDS